MGLLRVLLSCMVLYASKQLLLRFTASSILLRYFGVLNFFLGNREFSGTGHKTGIRMGKYFE